MVACRLNLAATIWPGGTVQAACSRLNPLESMAMMMSSLDKSLAECAPCTCASVSPVIFRDHTRFMKSSLINSSWPLPDPGEILTARGAAAAETLGFNKTRRRIRPEPRANTSRLLCFQIVPACL